MLAAGPARKNPWSAPALHYPLPKPIPHPRTHPHTHTQQQQTKKTELSSPTQPCNAQPRTHSQSNTPACAASMKPVNPMHLLFPHFNICNNPSKRQKNAFKK